MRGRGETESAVRTALQRRGGRGGAEAFKVSNAAAVRGGSRGGGWSNIYRQTVGKVPGRGTVTWMERRAAWWLTMTGIAEGPFLTRHPTLSVRQRRVPPRL